MSIRRWKYSEMIEWILCNMVLRLQLWSSGGHQIMLSVCLCQMHLTSWCFRCSSQVRVWLGQVYVIVSPSSRFLYGQATSIPIKGVGIVKPQLRAAKTEKCHRRCLTNTHGHIPVESLGPISYWDTPSPSMATFHWTIESHSCNDTLSLPCQRPSQSPRPPEQVGVDPDRTFLGENCQFVITITRSSKDE